MLVLLVGKSKHCGELMRALNESVPGIKMEKMEKCMEAVTACSRLKNITSVIVHSDDFAKSVPHSETLFKILQERLKIPVGAFGHESKCDKFGKKYHYFVHMNKGGQLEDAAGTRATLESIAGGTFVLPAAGSKPDRRDSLEGRRSMDGRASFDSSAGRTSMDSPSRVSHEAPRPAAPRRPIAPMASMRLMTGGMSMSPGNMSMSPGNMSMSPGNMSLGQGGNMGMGGASMGMGGASPGGMSPGAMSPRAVYSQPSGNMFGGNVSPQHGGGGMSMNPMAAASPPASPRQQANVLDQVQNMLSNGSGSDAVLDVLSNEVQRLTKLVQEKRSLGALVAA